MLVAFTPTLLEGWAGGLNYQRNLLGAIADNPHVGVEPALVVGEQTPAALTEGLPAHRIIRTQLFDRRSPRWAVRAATRRLLGRDPLLERRLRSEGVIALSHSRQVWRSKHLVMLGWIPDYQHRRLPEFFSEKERSIRDREFARIVDRSTLVIVSSESARRDLARFQPDAIEKARVLRFVAEPGPAETERTPKEVAASYGIDRDFLFLPNQFWVHKNHRVVVEALGILRSRGVDALVVASGNQHDYRQPGHFDALAKRVSELDVGDAFRPLGSLPYPDVVALMRAARAVVNPSLCEGWSTSVEEARSLGKRTILSDIDVHREQNPPAAAFFDPEDPGMLADLIHRTLEERDATADDAREGAAGETHKAKRREFAEAYAAIVREATGASTP